MKYNKYYDLKKAQQDEFNNFIKGKIFFAFNDQQFLEGLKSVGLKQQDTDKLSQIRGGGFILKSEEVNYKKLRRKFDEEFKEHMKDYDFAKNAFNCELADHEFIYTYDALPTLYALNLTIEELQKNKMLLKAFNDAKKEYLKWHEEHD